MFIINLLLIICTVLIIAFLTLTEWKAPGYIQLCKGPNTAEPHGLLQPIANAIKLFIKAPLQPLPSSMYVLLHQS